MTVLYILAGFFVVDWADIPNVARFGLPMPNGRHLALFVADGADLHEVSRIVRPFPC